MSANYLLTIAIKSFYGLFKFLCLPLLLLTYHTMSLKANHAMAVDLTYTCLNPTTNTYQLTLWFYFDCGSTVIEAPPINPLIQISSASCGYQFNRNLSMVPSLSGIEVSQLCQTALAAGQSNCQGGTLPGVEQYVYRGTVTLPQTCSDWVFAYRLGGGGTRSADITNLNSPDFYKIYVETLLNNRDFVGGNSSPQFASMPVAYFCTQNNIFTQAMTEADGDSVVFSLAEPLDNVNTPIPHAFGTTAFNPIYDLNGALGFDTQTGNIAFGTSTVQRAVVAVLVSEYRNGQLIGSVRRDMQWVILDCVNQQPSVLLPNGNTFEVCADNVLSFAIKGALSGGVATTFFTNITTLAGATWTTTQVGDTTTAVFTWQPTQTQAGNYVLSILASDETCPIPAQVSLAIPIRVIGKPIAGSDIFYCDTANPLTVTVENGSSFTWQPALGLSFLTDNGSQVEIDPTILGSSGTQFIVTNNCGLSDSLHITAGNAFLLDIASQINLCRGDSAILSSTVLPVGDYSYAWSPDNGLSSIHAATVTASPTETTFYTLSVTDNNTGCQVVRNIAAIVADNITANLTASADTICIGQTVQLNTSATVQVSLPCGLQAEGGNCEVGLRDTLQVGTGLAETTDITPYNAFWENSHLQLLFRANELTAAGMGSATIVGIGFQVIDKYSSVPFETFQLKMGCSNINSLTNFAAGTTEVLNTTNVSSTLGWNWHILDTPYAWDGAANLLVELCQHIDDANVFDRVAYTATSFNSVCSAFTSSGSNGCTLSNMSLSNLRPDIRFIICRSNAPEPLLVWSPTEGLDNPNSLAPIASPQQTTTYTAQFSYNGCMRELSHTIVVPSPFTTQILAQNLGCNSNGNTIVLSFADALPASAVVQWLPVEGLDNATSFTPIATLTGNDTVNYRATVQLNDFCNTTFTDSITLSYQPLSITLPPDTTIVQGSEVVLTALGNFSDIVWSPTTALSTSNTATVTAAPTITTIYTATVNDEAGCTAAANVTITVQQPPQEVPCFVVPNAFSPNGDGTNDVFRPLLRNDGQVELQSMTVFNRYGQQVYVYTASDNNPTTAEWDGRYKGSHAEAGIYVCVITLLCNGEELVYRGWVGLVR